MAARGLAAALLPAALHRAGSVSACGGRGGGGIRLLSDLVEHLNCHPSYPILSNLTVPQVGCEPLPVHAPPPPFLQLKRGRLCRSRAIPCRSRPFRGLPS